MRIALVLLALLLLSACQSRSPAPEVTPDQASAVQPVVEPVVPVVAPEADVHLQHVPFFISDTQGFVPAKIGVYAGAVLEITSANGIRLSEKTSGFSIGIPAGSERNATFIPPAPGTYTLVCEGCIAGADTLTIDVR